MTITYTPWPLIIPNSRKIHQHFPFQGNNTQIGIFGLKNKPSGNPAAGRLTPDTRAPLCLLLHLLRQEPETRPRCYGQEPRLHQSPVRVDPSVPCYSRGNDSMV
jgi:hypothetical protein